MKRVIVAEGEQYLARMLRLALVRSGYRVTTATDGETAWQMLIGESPDALVVAGDLPGVGGIELCTRLRRELPHRDLPTILMTSRADSSVRREASRFGRVTVVDKPVSIRALLSQLDGFFAGESMVETLVGEERIR